MFEDTDAVWRDWIFWILFLVSNIVLTFLQFARIYGILVKRCYKNPPKNEHSLSDWTERQERSYPLLDTVLPVCGFFVLSFENKELAVFLILYSSWQCMRSLTMFPRIGKNVFITSKVTRTIMEFFFSYIIQILALSLSFHILLPHTSIFKYSQLSNP